MLKRGYKNVKKNALEIIVLTMQKKGVLKQFSVKK